MEAQLCVYILASRRNGTLYTGVTRYPVERIWQHKEGLVPGFTKKYAVRLLVYIELHDTMPGAIKRERQIKEWRRAWKVELIESINPEWRDLTTISGDNGPLLRYWRHLVLLKGASRGVREAGRGAVPAGLVRKPVTRAASGSARAHYEALPGAG